MGRHTPACAPARLCRRRRPETIDDMPVRLICTLSVLTALLVPQPGPAPGPAAGLTWQSCGDGAVQCATLTVPIDHADPTGPRLDLAVARLPARDPATRRGTVVFHGGGPAPSLPNLLHPARRTRLAELTTWFDVVTFDSRGYGASQPLCDPTLATRPVLAASAADYADQQRRTVAFADSCRDGSGLAEQANAHDTADDVEDLRIALGEDRIVFYGNSYGTVFGQAYAERHGRHLARLLLDSVADHTSSYLDNAGRFGRDREASLHRWAADCAADPGCPLFDADPLAVWDRVVEAAERAPIPAGGGRAVTALEIRLVSGVFGAPGFGGPAAEAVRRAAAGDGGGLAALLDTPGQTGDVGQLTECADFPVEPDDHAALLAAAERARADTPRVGWIAPLMASVKCAGWPLGGRAEPAPLHAPDAPPALVVNATEGGSTHLAGARHVADQLPGSAVLAVTGFAHSLYLAAPANRCVRDAVHHYLLDGVLPGPEAQCPV